MKDNWKNLVVEFISIFVAVVSGFALSNWNDNRKDSITESKILTEIYNGLEKDEKDVEENIRGHQTGINSCEFWRKILMNETPNLDSLKEYYISLTRDFISIQNTSGYETLKSKGFEILKNDSLRTGIISLYEYDFQIIRKLEEDYDELQFQNSYFLEINRLIAPNFEFNSKGNISGIKLPITINDSEKKILLTYLYKIKMNRAFISKLYKKMEEKIQKLRGTIDAELKR